MNFLVTIQIYSTDLSEISRSCKGKRRKYRRHVMTEKPYTYICKNADRGAETFKAIIL